MNDDRRSITDAAVGGFCLGIAIGGLGFLVWLIVTIISDWDEFWLVVGEQL